MSVVKIQNLTKTFRSRIKRDEITALRDVSLSVQETEVFGLLGPNGAGKTTLVKILLGIIKPTMGSAEVLGISVEKPEARRRIGYLPEDHRFPGYLTAEQMLNQYGRLAGVSEQDRKAAIPSLLELVKMEQWRETKIKKFSKGMMQRLGLSQVLLNNPDIVFLDEPTDGVDPIGRREIRDLLLWLQDRGKTVFLNSHLLSEVEQICTRVAILHKGRLIRDGSVAEITNVDLRYEIHATALPASLLESMDGKVRMVQPHQNTVDSRLTRYHVLVRDRAELNAVIDRLRDNNVEIDMVQPVRRTLEDFFIDVVRHDDL